MAKLYDEIMAGLVKVVPPRWIAQVLQDHEIHAVNRRFKKDLQGAMVFEISNISDYYYGGTDQEWFEPERDFPCPRPGYTHFWMEWVRPKTIRTEIKSKQAACNEQLKAMPDRTAVHGRVYDMSIPDIIKWSAKSVGVRVKRWHFKENALRDNQFDLHKIKEQILDAAVMVELSSYVNRGRVLTGPMHHTYIWLDHDGSIIDYMMNVETLAPSEYEDDGTQKAIEYMTATKEDRPGILKNVPGQQLRNACLKLLEEYEKRTGKLKEEVEEVESMRSVAEFADQGDKFDAELKKAKSTLEDVDQAKVDMLQRLRPYPGETIGWENHTYPAIMALSFIQIRNVRLVDYEVPDKLKRSHARKYGVDPVKWKTITLLPYVDRAVYAQPTEPVKGVGSSRAFEIIPGHYAHYGVVGPGGWMRGKLFGKITGRFWIPEHNRGDESVGIIMKDYRLKTDGEPEEKPRKKRK